METPKSNLITGVRLRAERVLFRYTDKGVRTMAIRLSPFVHGEDDRAFTARYIQCTQRNREANYVGDGENIWPAVNRLDAARLYRLAMERGEPGSVYHAVAEGVTAKQAATAVGERLNLPVRSVSAAEGLRRFGWFDAVASLNTPANSRRTQEELGWKPEYSDFISDVKADHYYRECGF